MSADKTMSKSSPPLPLRDLREAAVAFFSDNRPSATIRNSALAA